MPAKSVIMPTLRPTLPSAPPPPLVAPACSSSGMGAWANRVRALLYCPATYVCLVLLCIAAVTMARPTLPPRWREFLMVAFACLALIPERRGGGGEVRA